jgi:hypothetical protein
MSGIPEDLYRRCRQTLLKCDQFRSGRSLRAVFAIEPLQPFRVGLSLEGSQSDLVAQNLDYLLDQRLTDGRPVLPIFLAALCEDYEDGNKLRDELQSLCRDVQTVMIRPEPRSPQASQRPQLFDMLLRLDFGEQVRIVKQVIEAYRVAAFLVHGEVDCGQKYLVNRLVRLIPGWQSGKRIIVDVGSSGIGKSSHALWWQVASHLNLPSDTSTAQLAREVCKWWRTQDVIFVLHTVDYMLPRLLAKWIDEFWKPLVAAANRSLHLTRPDTHMLMFLVDYSGCVCKWNVELAWQPDRLDSLHVPLYLPPASRFSAQELNSWMTFAAELLPAGLTADALLIDSDNGIPALIYEAIKRHCGFSWEGELTEWLI